MKFTDAPGLDTATGIHLNGLPAIGFSYKEYTVSGTMTQDYTYTSPLLR